MRVKVELHPGVVWFVRKCCTQAEQDEFYRKLEALRSNAISESQPIAEPRLSRYMLRFFRFGPANLAIFEWDAGRNRVRVIECRKASPKPSVGRGRRKPP